MASKTIKIEKKEKPYWNSIASEIRFSFKMNSREILQWYKDITLHPTKTKSNSTSIVRDFNTTHNTQWSMT